MVYIYGGCVVHTVYYIAVETGDTGDVTSSHQGGDAISQLSCIFIVALVTQWFGLVRALVHGGIKHFTLVHGVG